MGGFDAKVTKGAFKDRKVAKIAAEEKTIRNLNEAIKRATGGDKDILDQLKNDLKEAKGRLTAHKAAKK